MATFVLVPGAWLGSWVWRKITPSLEKKGNSVYPVTLTGMGDRVHLARKEYGIETAVEDVVNLITFEDLRDVILVGHSFAGKVISAVYDRIPERIQELFFLDAFIPGKVRTPQGGKESESQEYVKQMIEESERNGDGWKYPMTEVVISEIAYDVTGDDRKWFLSKITPWPLKLAFDPITISEKVDNAKKSYIFCMKEGEDISDKDRKYLDQLEGKFRIIQSGHYPMITKPDEVVDALVNLT